MYAIVNRDHSTLTSSTIREKLRLKRRSEQTQKSFRAIRERMYQAEKLQRQRLELEKLSNMAICRNQGYQGCGEVNGGGWGNQGNAGQPGNYHQNLCVNVNISNVNIRGNGDAINYQNPWANYNGNIFGWGQQQAYGMEMPANYGQLFGNFNPPVQPRPANENPRPNSPSPNPKPIQIPPEQQNVLLRHKHYLVYNKIIGTGTYSKVYLGYDTTRKIKVAVKEISELEDNEIKVLMSVDSPFIIRLLYHWKNQGSGLTYLVLELCERNLRQEIKRNISYQQKLKYIGHVVSGMDALFEKNIIHRDLKFENILVTKEQVAKITDFGLAKDMGVMSNVASLRCGTPYTMAPEIFFHNGYSRPYYNQKCDIWSLAVILHETLYNRHPFNYDSERMLRMDRVYINKKYGYLDAIIDRALVKDSGSRIGWAEFKKIYQEKGMANLQREIKNQRAYENANFKKKKNIEWQEKPQEKEKKKEKQLPRIDDKSSLLLHLLKKAEEQKRPKFEIKKKEPRNRLKEEPKVNIIEINQKMPNICIVNEVTNIVLPKLPPAFEPIEALPKKKKNLDKSKSNSSVSLISNKDLMVPVDIFQRKPKAEPKIWQVSVPEGRSLGGNRNPADNLFVVKFMFVAVLGLLVYFLNDIRTRP